MKKVTAILISVLLSATTYAKDLHFIYVRLDRSMDTEITKKQLDKLLTSLSDSDFILYYSNENVTMSNQSWDREKLFRQISSQNSSISISVPDELESISCPLENQLQEESYASIYFDCFVSSEFFNNNYHDLLFARMLIVNNLAHSVYHVLFNYYPCGATYSQEKIKFNQEYNINRSAKIITSL